MARDFDGSTQSVSAAQSIVTASPFTMSAWYNVDVAHAGTIGGLFDAGASAQYYRLFNPSAGTPALMYQPRGSGNGTCTTSNTTALDTWAHACAVETNADSTKHRIILNADFANEGSSTTSATVAGIDDITIAVENDDSPGQFFNGRVAEFAVWGIDLSNDEITALGNGMSPLLIRPASLQIYLPLISNEKDIVGGLSLTGTAPSAYPHPPIIRPSAQILQFPPPAAASAADLTRFLSLLGVG